MVFDKHRQNISLFHIFLFSSFDSEGSPTEFRLYHGNADSRYLFSRYTPSSLTSAATVLSFSITSETYFSGSSISSLIAASP